MNTARVCTGSIVRCWILGIMMAMGGLSGDFNVWAQEDSERDPPQSGVNDVGNYLPFLRAYANEAPFTLSYLSKRWDDRERWRVLARAQMHELLSYDPPGSTLREEVLRTTMHDDYTTYHVRYPISEGRSTEAFLLVPDGLQGPAPAVMALHDHGGFYFYGKEKITECDARPPVLQKFIEDAYGGRAFADALARRGFVVLVPDAFYFGSQRIDVDLVSDRFSNPIEGLKPGTDEFIRAFNRFASDHETLMAKTIFTAGTTWPGILFQGDRASLDYLLSRPEVDPHRVGCMGLSIGGFRSAHLAGLDSRIAASVVAGWMTTYEGLMQDYLRNHTWMVYVPGQLRYLDLPDVAALNAPRPLMVINALEDNLFTLAGMQAAENKIAQIYGRMEQSDRFVCRYYDVPHSLNVQMQDDAIDWLEHWLK